MVSCQGCGESTTSRLCCPKCSEVGRTSFFCSQECFKDSWMAHSKLHPIIQQAAMLEPAIRRESPAVSSNENAGEESPSCSTSASAMTPPEYASGGIMQLQQLQVAPSSCGSRCRHLSDEPRSPKEVGPGEDNCLPVVSSRVGRGMALINSKAVSKTKGEGWGLWNAVQKQELPWHARRRSSCEDRRTSQLSSGWGPPRLLLLLLLLVLALTIYACIAKYASYSSYSNYAATVGSDGQSAVDLLQQLTDSVSELRREVLEHSAILDLLAPPVTKLAVSSRAQRAAGAIGEAVASGLTNPSDSAMERVAPILKLMEAAHQTNAAGPSNTPLRQRSFAAGIVSQETGMHQTTAQGKAGDTHPESQVEKSEDRAEEGSAATSAPVSAQQEAIGPQPQE